VRLTRHAKDRLRFIGRRGALLSGSRLLEALASADVVGEDIKGNRRLSIRIDDVLLTVVVVEARQIVITIWREE